MSLLNRALGMGRNLANVRMTETVTVGRYEDGTDEVTGDPIRVLAETHYTGPARVKYQSLTAMTRVEASQVFVEQEPMLSVPTGTVLADGDEVHVQASTVDPLLVGRILYVHGAPQSGQTTSERYPLKEV